MDTPFDVIVAFVIAEEGERSSDPFDPGKLTKWGISSRQFPQVLNQTFDVADAIGIYKKHYWDVCHCDEIPGGLAFLVFNMAVNQSPGSAIRTLQSSLGFKLAQLDGIAGPLTIAAAKAGDPQKQIDEFAARQVMRYVGIVDFPRFGLGWIRRLFRVHHLAIDWSEKTK